MAKKGMHGWSRLPSGEVAALFPATNLDVDCGTVDLLLRASTRSEAVQIAKDLGLHGVDLKSNPRPPRKDDLAALLASGQPLLWRDFAEGSKWQPRITLPHIK
jgi:hypothetical protein